VTYKSATVKTSWPALTVTSSKDRGIQAFFIGLTIMGKLGCPIMKKKNVILKIYKKRLVSRINPSLLLKIILVHCIKNWQIYRFTKVARIFKNFQKILAIGKKLVHKKGAPIVNNH
jgi:hypothetical protein